MLCSIHVKGSPRPSHVYWCICVYKAKRLTDTKSTKTSILNTVGTLQCRPVQRTYIHKCHVWLMYFTIMSRYRAPRLTRLTLTSGSFVLWCDRYGVMVWPDADIQQNAYYKGELACYFPLLAFQQATPPVMKFTGSFVLTSSENY